MKQLTDIATSIINFINTVAVPLIFAVAFIVFLFGVFRFYIAGATNPEKRQNGTQLIMYSIIGFVVMIVVWGLVNLVVHTFNFTDNTRPNLPTFDPSKATNTSASPTTGSVPNNTDSNSANFKITSDPAKTPSPSALPDTPGL